MTRLLLIDDDRELTGMLAEYLGAEGFRIDAVQDGRQGLERAREGGYDVVVLDVMLPVMNGFEVLRELRKRCEVPVLMLTARGDDVDTIVGLELGADDYLPKPFNPRLLVARIRVLLRRAREPAGAAGTVLEVGDLVLSAAARRVTRGGQAVQLTGAEFNVLAVLLAAAGQVVAKEHIAREALGRELQAFDRSIDMHVSNLRHKLGALPDGSARIETVRGAGYQYVRAP